MHKKALLLAFLCLCFSVQFARGQALKNPNYVGGVQEAGRPVYPYTHAWFVSLNDSIQYPCGFNGTPTEQWGYTFFALATGGDVDATCYQQPFNITADIFSPVSKPILIYLPDVAITVTANVTVPSNFMFCYGPGSSFTAGVGYTLVNNAQPCNGSGGGKGQPVNWYTNGTLVGTEPGGDFDNGSSIAITGVDDPTNKEVHITVNASGMGCPTSGGVVPDSTICAGPASSGTLSPSVIQTQMIVQPAKTQSLTFGLPVKTGDDILVVVTCGANQSGGDCGTASGDTPVFSDSQTNSYSLQGSTGTAIAFGYKGAWVAKAIASASGALTVTVTNGYTLGYDAIGIIEASNIGIFEGSASNATGAPNAILVTASYTTLNSGDFLLSIGGGDTNNSAMVLYQNSADWLGIAAPQTFSEGSEVIWYGLAATQQGPTATRSVSWSTYPPGPYVISQVSTLIMAFEPATYPPPGSGPPSFRYQQPPDLPLNITSQKLQVAAQPYAAIPLCAAITEGSIAAVEDATVSSPGAIISVGGGTTHVQAYCNGTNWVVSSGYAAGIAPITFDNDTQSVNALATANLTGHTMMGYAATVYEIDVFADTGTSSVNISKVHSGTATALMSGALPSGASGAIACASLNAACVGGGSPSGTVSIVTAGSANLVAAGDIIEITGATADGTATRFTAMVFLH